MKKNKSFRESGRGESVGFFRVLGLTIIIVAVVFLITLTSSSERQEETTTGSQAPTQTTPVTETTPIRTTTESAPIITTTTIPPQTTTAPSLVPTNKEMKKLIEEKYLPIIPFARRRAPHRNKANRHSLCCKRGIKRGKQLEIFQEFRRQRKLKFHRRS
ncbi:MAG: hypothetical protein V8S82_07990 [Eubacteriales bacterium]